MRSGMMSQASSADTRSPSAQKMLRLTMMLPRCDVGRNSARMAPSTGMLPPTPKPRQKSEASSQVYEPMKAVIMPRMPPMLSVSVKGNLRSTTSEVRPHTKLPTHMPLNSVAASQPSMPWSMCHSFWIGVMMSVIASDHMLSAT